MREPTLETELRSLVRTWWETGRRDGAIATRVFGNRALTSWAGLLLLPGLAVVALSGLVFGNFWQLHCIAGLSLIPLLLVKLGTTSYRALSYYVRRAVYRAAGAPEWAGRLLAPALIVSTIIAMVGIALAIGLIVGLAGGARSPFPSRSTRAGTERSSAPRRASDLASGPLHPRSGSHSRARLA